MDAVSVNRGAGLRHAVPSCAACGRGVTHEGSDCPRCGSTNPIDARYCMHCGAGMHELPGIPVDRALAYRASFTQLECHSRTAGLLLTVEDDRWGGPWSPPRVKARQNQLFAPRTYPEFREQGFPVPDGDRNEPWVLLLESDGGIRLTRIQASADRDRKGLWKWSYLCVTSRRIGLWVGPSVPGGHGPLVLGVPMTDVRGASVGDEGMLVEYGDADCIEVDWRVARSRRSFVRVMAMLAEDMVSVANAASRARTT